MSYRYTTCTDIFSLPPRALHRNTIFKNNRVTSLLRDTRVYSIIILEINLNIE